MKKLIAMTLVIALLLGLLTIPAAAITPGSLFDPDAAEAHNKNAVKAADIASEKGELPGNVTVIVDDEDVEEAEDVIKEVEDEEQLEQEAEGEMEPEYPPAVKFMPISFENLLARFKHWMP